MHGNKFKAFISNTSFVITQETILAELKTLNFKIKIIKHWKSVDSIFFYKQEYFVLIL